MLYFCLLSLAVTELDPSNRPLSRYTASRNPRQMNHLARNVSIVSHHHNLFRVTQLFTIFLVRNINHGKFSTLFVWGVTVWSLQREHEFWAPVPYRGSRLSCVPELPVLRDVALSPTFAPRFVLPHTVYDVRAHEDPCQAYERQDY